MTIVLSTLRELKTYLGDRRAALTIGNFDGCHLGHQSLLSSLIATAKSHGLVSIAMTFEPHPAKVLGLKKKIFRVQTLQDRLVSISECGIDVIASIEFTMDIAQLSPADFVQKFLVESMNTSVLMVGSDFRFGKGREGTIEYLIQAGIVHGFTVSSCPIKEFKDQVISSSLLRTSISEFGDLAKVEELCGRKWSFTGVVVKGRQLGRTLGFPTANLNIGEIIEPKPGVYACWVLSGVLDEESNKRLPAIMNVGFRPTVENSPTESKIEVHILDSGTEMNLDLYGRILRIEPHAKIRDEHKFASLDDLKAQIAMDCERARTLLHS